MKVFKSFKLVLFSIVFLLLLVLGAAYVTRNAIVKSAIERGSSAVLGADTTVGSVSVDLFGGRFHIKRYRVANPEGFEAPTFLDLDRARIDLEKHSLKEKRIEFQILHLDGLNLYIERRGGKANYEQIIDNLKQFEEKRKEASHARGPGKKARKGRAAIREVIINDIKFSVELLPLGGELTRTEFIVDKIHLKNLGTEDEEGLSIADITVIVTKALLMSVLRAGNRVLPDEIGRGLGAALGGLGDLGAMGVDVVVFTVEGAVPVIGRGVKGFYEAGKGIGNVIKGLGEKVTGGNDDPGTSE